VTTGVRSGQRARPSIEPGSFRDRTARVFRVGDEIYRGLTATAWDEWQAVSAAPFFQRALNRGAIVQTELVDPAVIGQWDLDDHWQAALRHERVPFVSYPYEWCFGMLKDAALLQLELLTDALHDDVILKDATPFNVQWKGTSPVFIDVASFVRWRTGEPWAGYRQFCQLQLYPLFLQAYKGVSFQPWLRGRIDGIETDEMARLVSWRDWLRPGILTQVVVQNRLQRQFASGAPKVKRQLKEAGFQKSIVVAAVQRLRKLVETLEWKAERSTWVDYATNNTYDDQSARMKESFVEERLAARRGGMVWDLGCNTGRFSKIASRHADLVVAVDSDHASIERLYRELKSEGARNVIPLVGNVADLSPALGWRALERQAFIDRGRPDVVLCLALVHHLAITANIPIDDLVRWLNSLGADLIIEFPLPQDPMVQQLLSAKDQVYEDYTLDCFESSLAAHFQIRERLALPSGSRVIYHATPRAARDERQARSPLN
jgi:SAM-dependent methyltransferase